MERCHYRKVMQGRVMSEVANKTISVLVETYKNHSLYGKRVRYSKKYLVHDEENSAHIGDKVSIMETRPLSKRKFFRLVTIIEKAIK